MYHRKAHVPASEIDQRIGQLQARLRENDLDAALILQNSDLYYFSGTIQQSHLYVPAQGSPLLLARRSFERARAESAIETIAPLTSPKQLPDLLNTHGLARPCRLGMELDVLPANLYFMYARLLGDCRIEDVSPLIRMIRAIKSRYEIDTIREAARRADQVSAYAGKIMRPGMTELELAGQVEGYARKLGHQGLVRMRLWGSELFYGHLLAGASAAVPSYLASPTGGRAANPAVAQGAGFAVIKPNEPVLVDYVFAYNGYIADHTRIFCIGSVPDDLHRAHQAMLNLQADIKTMARPGVAAGDIYERAVALAAASGYAANFMGTGDQRVRFVGHGVGLELDEFPFLAKGQSMPLAAGMIIALEPKLIFPGKGVVGIENTHLVTDDGLVQLTVMDEAIQRVQT